ncbi:MAG: FKBP-type peptidyl-prolyl cis-trans isomerase [Cytophagaceae bacterium]|nr:FKBP-type peptidyl-prolyl cis-trans isomerase [Cytophagaceae bacterium]MDW8456577.1 FKBP-type peptidyl-prolyl cis-trans isomerase [Cytophagaceae bacterium]
MKIDKHTVVTLSYELHTDSAENQRVHVETAPIEDPLVFLYGAGTMIPKFEENLYGKQKGDVLEFKIDCEDAYGEFEEEAVVRIPIKVFTQHGPLDTTRFKVGAVIPMQDQHGHQMYGKILEITNNDIQMDFNHPMAGFDLYFKVMILDVRKATHEEIAHGHVHGPGGHHH